MDRKKQKRNAFIYFGVMIAIIIIMNIVSSTLIPSILISDKTYDEFLTMIDDGFVTEVEIGSNEILFTAQVGQEKTTHRVFALADDKLVDRLTQKGVRFYARDESVSLLESALGFIIPMALMVLFYVIFIRFMMKKMGGSGGVMSFGKNTAKIYAENNTGKTFNDVAGQDEAKEALTEIVDFLKNPAKYTAIGAKLPKGALMVGPPGTGKTLLAKALAGEAGVPFFSMSGSDFVEMFVGVGAARVRDLFKQAMEKAPCIVFIDEIDAIGKKRDNSLGSNDEREQTLNQLLGEMDGFDSSKGVVILAATNRPEVLDPALLRPGRFDRRIIVENPDLIGREAILKVHSRDVCIDSTVNLTAIAKMTSGASGADLANIINEAALRAVRQGRRVVSQADLMAAVELVIAGAERKNKVMSAREKQIVAYHEIGHALVSARLKDSQPIQKITIVPRTMGALGYTMQAPEEDRFLLLREEAITQITTLLGGRAAEEVRFGTSSSGASNDIEKATKLARNMVTRYGMSKKFDMMGLAVNPNPYLGDDTSLMCSQETAADVDREVLDIIKECHNHAIKILLDNRNILDELTTILIRQETLTGEEFMQYLKKAEQHHEN